MANRPRRLPIYGSKFWNPVYFVTYNVLDRVSILANDAVHTEFKEFASVAYTEYGISVGEYVIMPDHVHLFVRGNLTFHLGKWVGLLKRAMSRGINQDLPHWQEGLFDHILRNWESYSLKCEYVRMNPVRAGLVKNPEDWPYQGAIVDLSF